jgi:hypothetical protein
MLGVKFMYNRITEPSNINKQVIPLKNNEINNREYIDDYSEGNDRKPFLSKVGKAVLALLLAIIVLASLFYLFFDMNLSYQPVKGLEFQVLEYSKKDKTLTLKISSDTPLAEDYSIESYESNNNNVFIRIRKPLITLRPGKSGRGEEADVYEYICHIFAEYDDNVYFKGTKSDEAVFIWAENIYKLK